MTAFYNEIDPYAAQWLRNLIDAGHIAPGVVDERSIVDLEPDELRGFTQCHFFAGIGVWSRALRLAGWPDSRPVWTGSCPCQPFSAAGKGEGLDDARHLWPAWHRLIRECRPPSVFGEQVASSDGIDWLALVHADMESSGFAFGAADLPAAGVGAPHIRQRIFFVAHAGRERGEPDGFDLGSAAGGEQGQAWERERVRLDVGAGGLAGLMAHPESWRLGQGGANASRGNEGTRPEGAGLGPADDRGGGLAYANGRDASEAGTGWLQRSGEHGLQPPSGRAGLLGNAGNAGNEGLERSIGFPGVPGRTRGDDSRQASERAGVYAGAVGDACGARLPEQWRGRDERAGSAAPGFWSRADWLPCRDGKARPVEPGTFPLAHGATARVGRLRAYGNAIVAPAAAEFIKAAIGA